MPTKVQRITELYGETLLSLSEYDNWISFLKTSARQYKYPFDDQVLIYAQRPDATACAGMEVWNRNMRRWINKGAKGIALLRENGGRYGLTYVFDVSDTNDRYGRNVSLWEYDVKYEDAVKESLLNSFGDINTDTIYTAVLTAAHNAVEDNMPNYIHELKYSRSESFLNGLDNANLEYRFGKTAEVSAAYMILERLNLPPEAILDNGDFEHIREFNTRDTVTILGSAVSSISENALREISRTIAAKKRQEKFAQSQNIGYNTDEREKTNPKTEINTNKNQNSERTDYNGRDSIQNGGRLRDSRTDGTGNGGTAWQVRNDVENVFEEPQTDTVHTAEDVGRAAEALGGDGQRSNGAGSNDSIADGESGGRDGNYESQRPDEMDGSDEQFSALGGGNSAGGGGLQLNLFDITFPTEDEQRKNIERAELNGSAFSMPEIPRRIIDEVLCDGSNERDSIRDICVQYAKNKPKDSNIEFLKEHYGIGGKGFIIDGHNVAVWWNEDGIRISYGNTAVDRGQLLTWEQADSRILELLESGRFAPREILDGLGEYERNTASNAFWYMRHDVNFDDYPELKDMFKDEWFSGGFPDSTARIAEYLTKPEKLNEFIDVTNSLLDMYMENSDIMRFSTYRPERVYELLTDLRREHRHFVSKIEPRSVRRFITDDEINSHLIGYSGYNPMRIRTYDFFTANSGSRERVSFLKSEYGTTTGWAGGTYSGERNSKGITLSRADIVSPFEKIAITWTDAAMRINKLIKADRYLSEKDKTEHIPQYRDEQERQRIKTEHMDFVGSMDNMSDDERRDNLPKLIYSFVRSIDGYERGLLTQNGFENLPEMTQNDIAKILKNSERRLLLAENFQKLGGAATRVYERNTGYRFAEELKALPDITLDNAKEYDLGFGELGNGVTVWNRLEEVNHDYKTVAHIEPDGEVTYYEDMPDEVKARIEHQAERESAKHNEKAADELIQTKTEAVYPGEKNNMPYDIVIQTISTKAQEPKVGNFRIADDNLGVGGAKTKFRANMDAVNLLKTLERDNRQATEDEQEILSKYVGWGSLPDAFDKDKENWDSEYKELINALTPEEYSAAKASVLNAHYTSPTVIRAIYQAVENMGFTKGNILEPSMGIGNFFGMLPESMAQSNLYGVELDSLTGRIAKQLYPKADITIAGFETTDRRDFYDLAVGNVPFGQYQVNDKAYNKLGFPIHDYFIAKAIDQVRPGGVIAFVTSRYTMDKQSPDARKYFAKRAAMLGAIRLPNTAFKANAGTEVVSDILFFQKRERPIEIEPDWVHLGENADGYAINSYFIDHPEMVLGRQTSESTQYGRQDFTVAPYEGVTLEEQLNEAIQNIHAQITEYEIEDISDDKDLSIPAEPDVRNFSYTVVGSDVYFRENSRMTKVDVSLTAKNRIKGMIKIRDCVRELIEYQAEDYPDEKIKAQQEKLNTLYDEFTSKYGLINSRGNNIAFSSDSSYFLLCTLEVLNEDKELKRKADIFTKRTIGAKKTVTHTDTASEALSVSIGEKAHVDMEYMTELTDKTEQELYEDLKGVIFLNPQYTGENHGQEKYLTADEYLSGNVREKLAAAKQYAEQSPDDYTVNVEALTAVQPKDLTASEITVRLGTTWIPESDVKDFMFELLNTSFYGRRFLNVHYSKITGTWSVEGKSRDGANVKANNTYGTRRINAYKIIEDTLNLKDVRIFDYFEDENGKRKAVLNKKETTIAQQKQELIKQAFSDWIWKDPARRERLTRLYNDKFNSVRPREYDGSHITFSGMNPEIELRPHQKNAVARIMYGGNTLLGHVVGAGKTWTMAAAAMEMKRLGLCNKSMFVVPNHLTEQWASEFLQLYPAANILVATKKDFETKNRKKFCGRIATGEYDAVIIGHSQFEKIPMSVERQKNMLQRQIDEIIEGIAEAKANNEERFTVKQMMKTKKSLEVKLEKLNDQSRKDDVVTFEELGVDRLFVDESHFYKNLYLVTKMRNVGGIAQTEAQKSSDMFMKCRYMDEITGGKGCIQATGTPLSNSMVEMYTVQRYLQYNTLVKNDLQHFDAWASTFGETVTAIELAPEGSGYRAKTRFARFYNLPELMTMFKEVADIQTADMLNLPVPEAEFHNIAAEPTEMQRDMVKELGERAEKVRAGAVEPNIDNMLKITNDGRKLALDQRMMNEMLPDENGTKVSICADNVFKIWQNTIPNKGTQLVFCDLSTPKNNGHFNVYDDIRDKLIEKGIPENEIAFIHNANTEVQKKDLFAKVRAGDVRVLLGSTQKMGAGTNVQTRLVALHDLDVPWRPSDLEQRLGRIVRQGNENAKVDIFRYVTKDTFDSYMYQTVEAKQKFIAQIMTSKSPVRSAEDIDETALSYAEIKALATGNPYIKEKMELDTEVAKLKLLKSSFMSQKYELEDKVIKYYPQQIKITEERIRGFENDIETLNNYPKTEGVFYPMTIGGSIYTEKEQAGKAVIEKCRATTSPEPRDIGEYRGFKMILAFDTFSHEHKLSLQGSLSHTITLGTDVFGNIQRIDNGLEGMPKRLTDCRAALDEANKQFETAKLECKKDFPQEKELAEKLQRLTALDALLNMDKREPQAVDMSEPDEDVPKRKNKDLER